MKAYQYHQGTVCASTKQEIKLIRQIKKRWIPRSCPCRPENTAKKKKKRGSENQIGHPINPQCVAQETRTAVKKGTLYYAAHTRVMPDILSSGWPCSLRLRSYSSEWRRRCIALHSRSVCSSAGNGSLGRGGLRKSNGT
jgi:hypothetical protein